MSQSGDNWSIKRGPAKLLSEEGVNNRYVGKPDKRFGLQVAQGGQTAAVQSTKRPHCTVTPPKANDAGEGLILECPQEIRGALLVGACQVASCRPEVLTEREVEAERPQLVEPTLGLGSLQDGARRGDDPKGVSRTETRRPPSHADSAPQLERRPIVAIHGVKDGLGEVHPVRHKERNQ